MGEPDDIAGAVLYLASDAASWVTGQLILVAGGRTQRTHHYLPAGRSPILNSGHTGPMAEKRRQGGDSAAKEADSAATKRRILDVARAAFASAATTPRPTGIWLRRSASPPARSTTTTRPNSTCISPCTRTSSSASYGRFNEAVDGLDGFLEAFDSVLDVAHQLNEADPTIAAFIGATRADMRRHAEISASLADHTERRNAFFHRLIDAGVTSGEIDPTNREFMVEFVSIILVGLTDGVSDDSARHKRAVTSIKMALRGDLVKPV